MDDFLKKQIVAFYLKKDKSILLTSFYGSEENNP